MLKRLGNLVELIIHILTCDLLFLINSLRPSTKYKQIEKIIFNMEECKMYTTSMAFLEALQEAGVSYVFANLGSDHPAIIEALASARKENKKLPDIIICPHEMVALSAAHGYAQATGEPQAVIIHVDVGTQNLGGAVHNASKGRIPVLIYAGAPPYTQEGELIGSRNEHILWLQDVYDQRGIVREYMKYDNEIRSGKNVKQLVYRALQFAKSDPKGPVYLMGPREVMEEETEAVDLDLDLWEPIATNVIDPKQITNLVEEMLEADNPLIVTSYVGRNPDAVTELVRLSERLAIPVLESVPSYMNFPTDHPMHCGFQWNEPVQNEVLAEADMILVIDSDVPWMTTVNKPPGGATIYYLDVDPLKERMPLWYIPSKRFLQGDSYIALQQINECLDKKTLSETEKIKKRWEKFSKIHQKQEKNKRLAEQSDIDVITPEYLTACVRDLIDDQTILLNEGISNYGIISNHIGKVSPGSLFGSGTSSLGWNGGAAIGIKLAHPDKTVISLTGDGTYLFSIPATVHWMAKEYDTPFLTVIYNNHGWKSPKLSTLGVHPEGVAKLTNQFGTTFNTSADLSKIAEAAGGAFAQTVNHPDELKEALEKGLAEVKSGRSAVIDVRLKKISDE